VQVERGRAQLDRSIRARTVFPMVRPRHDGRVELLLRRHEATSSSRSGCMFSRVRSSRARPATAVNEFKPHRKMPINSSIDGLIRVPRSRSPSGISDQQPVGCTTRTTPPGTQKARALCEHEPPCVELIIGKVAQVPGPGPLRGRPARRSISAPCWSACGPPRSTPRPGRSRRRRRRDRADLLPRHPGLEHLRCRRKGRPGAPEFSRSDQVICYVRGEVAHQRGGYAELVSADVRTPAPNQPGASGSRTPLCR
jgi:hypothetical protein